MTQDNNPVPLEEPKAETTRENITEAALPDLVGAESEIAAAQEVRTRILMEADDLLSRLRAQERLYELPDRNAPPGIAVWVAALQALRGQEDAAWWLANRDAGARALLEALHEHVGR